jgi:haloalkane dehalogenase
VDEGTGPAVVMLHGNPTWSFFYRDLIKAVGDTHRVVVPDHMGCGLSDKPDDHSYPYTLSRRVDDVEALLDHVGVQGPFTLVVHDWGGMIGMAWAVRNPQRVRSLVILNTAAFQLPAGKRLPWSLRLARNTVLGPLLVRGLNALSRGAVRHCAVRGLSPAVREGYLAPYDSWRNRIAVLRFVRDIPLHPGDASYELVTRVQERLGQFRDVPMLICWGERDFVFDRDFLAEWRRRCPEAEVHAFPDAGHFVLEDAGQEIVPLVKEFLARQAAV